MLATKRAILATGLPGVCQLRRDPCQRFFYDANRAKLAPKRGLTNIIVDAKRAKLAPSLLQKEPTGAKKNPALGIAPV